MVATDSESGRGYNINTKILCIGKNALSAEMSEASSRSRNGALPRKGCAVNGQMTKAGNK